MTIYYADIDQIGSGGSGTAFSPWECDSALLNLNTTLVPGDTLRIQGKHDYAAAIILGQNGIIIQRDAGEQLRIKATQINNFCTINEAIIEATGAIYNEAGSVLNSCFVRSENSIIARGNPLVNGCSFITPLLASGSHAGLIAKDSTFDYTTESASFAYGGTSLNCVFYKTALPTSGTHENYQINLTPPTWPAWNAPQNSFLDTALSIEITTPPKLGNAPYTGYELGLWESTRNGIGAFKFIPSLIIKYVDLNQVSSGSGIISDPFNLSDFETDVHNATISTNYKIKGICSDYEPHDWCSTTNPEILHSFEAWDPLLYGPFRIAAHMFYIRPLNFKNGILQCYSMQIGKAGEPISNIFSYLFTNSYFQMGYFFQNDVASNKTIFKGCSIKSNSGCRVTGNAWGLDFNSCLIDIPDLWINGTIDPHNTINLKYSAVSKTRTAFLNSYIANVSLETGMQYSWTPPTWPAYDAAKESFDKATMVNSATTPPVPGDVPYNNFNMDLFGGTRNDIGATYSPPPPPPTIGARYIAKVTAHGWTKNNIYEWSGTSWLETVAVKGMCVHNKEPSIAIVQETPIAGYPVVWCFDGSDWHYDLALHAIGDQTYHMPSSIGDFEAMISGVDFVFSTRENEIKGLTEKETPILTDWLLIEDSEDQPLIPSKKSIQIGALPFAPSNIIVEVDNAEDEAAAFAAGAFIVIRTDLL